MSKNDDFINSIREEVAAKQSFKFPLGSQVQRVRHPKDIYAGTDIYRVVAHVSFFDGARGYQMSAWVKHAEGYQILHFDATVAELDMKIADE